MDAYRKITYPIFVFFVLLLLATSVGAQDAPEPNSNIPIIVVPPLTNGTPVTLNPTVESDHPYADSEDKTWSITNSTGFNAMSLHFSRIEIEDGVDKIYISDVDGKLVQVITTSYPDGLWTDVIPGGGAQIRLVSDSADNAWGFAIDQIDPIDYTTLGRSPHPYLSNSSEVKSFTNLSPNPTGTRVYFDRLEVEANVDYVIILDANDVPYQWITGSYPGGFTSMAVPGSVVKVKLVSDGSIEKWGYNVAAVENAAPDTPDDAPYNPQSLAESAHPYASNTDQTWTIVNPDVNAVTSKVHFSRLETYGGDDVHIMDENDNVIQILAGTQYDFWSDYVPGRIVKIRFTTGRWDQTWGFRIDEIANSVTIPDLVQSRHPYVSYTDQTWTIVNPDVNAVSSKVHFARIETYGGDNVHIMDENDNVIQILAGTQYDFWSDYVPGRIVKIRFTTGQWDQTWGFRIDKIVNSVTTPGLVQSRHPYVSYTDQTWTIVNPDVNAVSSKVHFARIETYGGDNVHIMDENDNVIQILAGTQYDFWSDYVPGRIVKIRFTTGQWDQTWGFRIDKIATNSDESPPVVRNDTYATYVGAAITVNPKAGVLTNDYDPEDDALTAIKMSNPANGSVAFSSDGSFTYTPNAGFTGDDTFTYKANDGVRDSPIATVRINVAGTNGAPAATDDAYSTKFETDLVVNVTYGVLANDTDADGDTMTALKVSDPSNGLLTLDGDGTITYTPNAGFNGTDTFTYQAFDGLLVSNVATVTITVGEANNIPTVNNDSYQTDYETELVVDAANGVLSNDTDSEGSPLTAALVNDVTNGTLTLNADGSFSYTPNTGFAGDDTFTYVANDGEDDSAPATVTITVASLPNAPVATDDSYTTAYETQLTLSAANGVLTNDTDADGDSLTAALVSDVSNGSLTLNADGSFTYTPNTGFSGDDTFTYVANDGNENSNTATVTISVDANPNREPVATDDSYTTAYETQLTVNAASGVLTNDTDADGDSLTAALVSDVSNGSLTLNADGSFTYTPNAGYSGDDTFTYVANDGMIDSNTATVTITVQAEENIPPEANNDTYITPINTPLTAIETLGVLVNDTDANSDPLTAALVDDVSNGSLTLNANGSFTYTPDNGFTGTDSFTYRANDGEFDSNVATVSITINRAPVAQDDVYAVASNTSLDVVAAFGLLSNDTDPDGNPLAAIKVTDPNNGTLTLNTDGSFSYTPVSNFGGMDSFTYKVNDGNLDSNTATVTINVVQSSNPPELLAPTGLLTDTIGRPLFQWTEKAGADAYQLFVGGSINGAYNGEMWFFEQNITSANCDGLTCSMYLTDIDPKALLSDGEYMVFLNTANGTPVEWKGPFMFRINAQQPTVPAITGVGNMITWTLDGNGIYANEFYLYIAPQNDILSPVVNQPISRLDACGSWESTTCLFTTSLRDGTNYVLYLNTEGPGGPAIGGNVPGLPSWLECKFTPESGVCSQPPAEPTNLNAQVNNGTVTLTWTPGANATEYQIWAGIISPLNQVYYDTVSASDLGCDGGTCTLTIPNVTESGTYSWFVQANGPGGVPENNLFGWTVGPEFNVPGS